MFDCLGTQSIFLRAVIKILTIDFRIKCFRFHNTQEIIWVPIISPLPKGFGNIPKNKRGKCYGG